jgi:hypothetical protein
VHLVAHRVLAMFLAALRTSYQCDASFTHTQPVCAHLFGSARTAVDVLAAPSIAPLANAIAMLVSVLAYGGLCVCDHRLCLFVFCVRSQAIVEDSRVDYLSSRWRRRRMQQVLMTARLIDTSE